MTTTDNSSRDPVISAGAAISEGPISLSTDGEGRTDGNQSTEGRAPDGAVGTSDEADDAELPPQEASAEESPNDSTNPGKGIRQIAVICSVCALLSGAVLVLLKFIR